MIAMVQRRDCETERYHCKECTTIVYCERYRCSLQKPTYHARICARDISAPSHLSSSLGEATGTSTGLPKNTQPGCTFRFNRSTQPSSLHVWSIHMKRGFLLREKTPIQEKSNSSIAAQDSCGPLHDARSGRPIYGWSILTRLSRDIDSLENLMQNKAPDQGNTMKKGESHSVVPLDDVKRKCNPYQGVPVLPYKTYSVPMNALDCYYGKYYKNHQIKMSENYFSWNDENPKSHLLRWTSIFLCPITGEIFVTGSWPLHDPLPAVSPPAGQTIALSSHEEYPQISDKAKLQAKGESSLANCRVKQCRWMKTVKDAKHGAAAWAYDCFQHRNKCLIENSASESSKGASVVQVVVTGPIGNEIPYLEGEGMFTLPEFVPLAVRSGVEQRQEEIRIGAMKCRDGIIDVEMKEELAWHSLKNHLELTVSKR